MDSELGKVLWAARRGDALAIERLEQEYGDHLRRVAKRLAQEMRLTLELDGDDLVGSMFRVLLLDPQRLQGMTPLEVAKYAEVIVRHKAINHHRRMRAAKRDIARRVSLPVETIELPDRNRELPEFEWQESLNALYHLLSSVERQICAMVRAGYDWHEIGRRLNLSTAAVRKRFQRAFRKVAAEPHKANVPGGESPSSDGESQSHQVRCDVRRPFSQ